MTFEESLKALEAIAKKLEDGECSLDESIKLYEEAMVLSKNCTELLSEAKLKIIEISELEKAEDSD